MATQLEQPQVLTAFTRPLNKPHMQESGLKERFYRYFQEEVTGKAFQSHIALEII
jgi:hypothetical protein